MKETDSIAVGDKNSLCGIISTVMAFADRRFQTRIWVRALGPEVSSYREARESLDDFRVRYFANAAAKKYGFSEEMLEDMRSFVQSLDQIEELATKFKHDEELIATEEWNAVVIMAQRFLRSTLPWYERNCLGAGGIASG
jgi:hypothetical protein